MENTKEILDDTRGVISLQINGQNVKELRRVRDNAVVWSGGDGGLPKVYNDSWQRQPYFHNNYVIYTGHYGNKIVKVYNSKAELLYSMPNTSVVTAFIGKTIFVYDKKIYRNSDGMELGDISKLSGSSYCFVKFIDNDDNIYLDNYHEIIKINVNGKKWSYKYDRYSTKTVMNVFPISENEFLYQQYDTGIFYVNVNENIRTAIGIDSDTYELIGYDETYVYFCNTSNSLIGKYNLYNEGSFKKVQKRWEVYMENKDINFSKDYIFCAPKNISNDDDNNIVQYKLFKKTTGESLNTNSCYFNILPNGLDDNKALMVYRRIKGMYFAIITSDIGKYYI